jgi:methyl-accepting chemotaxis protein
MSIFANVKQKTLLTVLPIVFVAAFGIFQWFTKYAIDQIKVGSPSYKNIIQDKDLLADYLPPPLYVVETYATVLQMAISSDTAERTRLIESYQKLKQAYDERLAYWDKDLKDGPAKEKIMKGSAHQFFQAVERDYLPLVQQGDLVSANAMLTQVLLPLYTQHRAQVDDVVQLVNEKAKRDEDAVSAMISDQAKVQLLIGVAALAIVLIISLMVRSMAVKQQMTQEKLISESEGLRQREQDEAARLRAGVEEILHAVHAAAKGDLNREIHVDQDGAIGDMAEGLRSFLNDLRQSIGAISSNAVTLSTASEQLSSVSQEMTTHAVEASSQASTASAASEQLSVNVQTVAAGTEEMSASIREIARSAAEAAKVAASAVQMASAANATIEKLADSSNEVGKVIKLITSVAQQTKTLALNATVEAARAGEAGKGFAVVANEVKELAKETAKATEDISQKIEAIQSDTRSAVEVIAHIAATINQINDIQNTIASAVEEQTATTNEMSRNLTEGAKGTNEIARNITGVAKAAQDTSAGAAKSLEAAQALSRMSAELERLVSKYSAAA